MAFQSNIQFGAVPPANVPTPSVGYYAVFLADGTSGTVAGFLYRKDSTGAVSSAQDHSGDFTNAKAQDAVGGVLQATDTVVLTYNTAGRYITANVLPASISATHLIDGAVATAKLADAGVTNVKLAGMAQSTFKMRAATTGTGAPIDGTPAQAKAALGITATDVSGLGTAATMNATAFDAAGLAASSAATAQANAIAAGNTAASTAQANAIAAANTAAATAQANAIAASQPLDSDLTAIAALATTAYGRSLLTLASGTAETALLDVASAGLKGLMSAADKAKLDAVNVSTRVRYPVTDFGMTPANTGAQNVTAWNTLMGSIPDNSEVYFPPGPSAIPFAGTLAIPAGKHLKIAGASNEKSIIQTTSATADIFTVGDWYNEFNGLKFTSSVTRTAGAAINSGNNVAVNVYNCDFTGMWDGIVYTGGVNAGNLAVIENCVFSGTLNRGIVLDGANANTVIDKVVMDGTAGQQKVGLELLQCGSLLVSNSGFIRAVNNLRFNPVSPNGVFSAYFINVFFDSATGSSVLLTNTGNIQRVKFTNCWFSGSVIGCEFASTATTLPTAIDFINCDIFNNSGRGIYANGVQDFAVTNSRIAGNGTAGIETNASTGSVTKFNVANNAICPTAGFGANGTGVLINAGTYGGYALKNNDVRNNTTNNITDNGTVATTDLKIINDNFGHIITGSIGNLTATATTSGTGDTALLVVRIPAKAASAGQVVRFRLIGLSNNIGTLTFRVHAGNAGSVSDSTVWTSITSAAQNINQRAGFDGTLTVRTAGASGTVQAEALGFAQAALLPTTVAAVTTPTVNTTTPWYITLSAACSFGSFIAQQAVVEAL